MFSLIWLFKCTWPRRKKILKSILKSSIMVRLSVHININNIMTRVVKTTQLNCKYISRYSMKLFRTFVFIEIYVFLDLVFKFTWPRHKNKLNSSLKSSILVRLSVLLYTYNIMTRIMKSTVLNCQYLGGHCMKLL